MVGVECYCLANQPLFRWYFISLVSEMNGLRLSLALSRSRSSITSDSDNLSSRISESRSCWFMITFMMFVYITRLISVKNALAAVAGTTPLPRSRSRSTLLAVPSVARPNPDSVCLSLFRSDLQCPPPGSPCSDWQVAPDSPR